MITMTMPQAGQSMEEGTILSWRKKEGDTVRKGEVLLEVETDKATIEVEATTDGVLGKILCPAGSVVPVLAPIALLGAETGDFAGDLREAEIELSSSLASKGTPAETPPTPGPLPEENSPAPSVGPVVSGPWALRASPAARKLAREHGIDLSRIRAGSGPGGRVLLSDLDQAAAKASETGPTRRPMTGMRKAIARALLASKQSIPHFYMRLTIDAQPLLAFHRSEKASCPCTLTDVILLGCARAMMEFPAFRSRIEGEGLVEYPGANIGMAVGMEEGLRVPVLLGAERLRLSQLAAETRRIVAAAQQGKVEAMGQGQFTVSNLGMFGVEEFSAIINPPETAILAVGAVRESVVVHEQALKAGRVMTMTLSADHRIVDGLLAAKFLARLKELLEAPERMES